MACCNVVGINFDHMHMGDNLRMAHEHPGCRVVGLCDEKPERMAGAGANFGVPEDRLFTDYGACIEQTRPDLVILCPATAHHGVWTERVAPLVGAILMEKPFAATLAEADAMIDVCESHGTKLAINWPLAWVPSHRTAKRLVDEGAIGEPREVHFYDGNRGPLWHAADKVEIAAERVEHDKPESWFYKKESGGGSMLDYLGYGVTLGTWYLNGKKPIEVTCTTDESEGLEVDEHAVAVARYAHGLSKFETRWGTFTDPWTHQPQPMCGFVLVGTEGTLSSYDYQPTVRLQTRAYPEGKDVPVDVIRAPHENPVQYMVHCLENDLPIEGALSPAVSRVGQQIVDTAYRSAQEKRTLPLVE